MNGIPLQSSYIVVPSSETRQSGILKLSLEGMLSLSVEKVPEDNSTSGTMPFDFRVKSAYTSPDRGAFAFNTPKL